MSGDPDFASAVARYLGRRLQTDLVFDRTEWREQRQAMLKELADLSFSSVLLSEKLGGLGFGAADLVPVFYEAGRRLLPLPLLDAVVSAPVVANLVDDPDGRLARAVVEGRLVGFASPADDPWAQGEIVTGSLTTTGLLIDSADIATDLVVACISSGQPAYALVAMNEVGVSMRQVRSADPCRRLYVVDVHQAPAEPLMSGSAAVECHARLTSLGRIATAAETAGVMRACLDMATDYAKLRVQFGRTIGSFQALKHILAGCWRDCYALDSVCESAAAAVDRADSAAAGLVLAAKIWSAKVGRATVESTLQACGAVAFTAEHSHHLFLKRALTLEGQLGELEPLLIEAGRAALVAHGEVAQ